MTCRHAHRAKANWPCRHPWVAFAVLTLLVESARAQIVITEILANPAGDEDAWEWVEIRNTSAAPVNLNGWVLGDRASHYAAANISSTLGNTIVPAGGVAVIYPSTAMGSSAQQRFADAWGSGIILIKTSGFPTLNNTGGERIGIWNSHDSYFIDATSEPDWGQAVFELDIATANGFPGVSGSGPSIAWTGSGSVSVGSNWEVSEIGVAGARKSNETFLPPTQINSSLDRGNPGIVPSGTPPAGMRITEVMYNPASPAVSQGYSEGDFEWIEVLNNTGSNINFNTTKYVFDDNSGNDLTVPNVTTGSLANGQIGVLFNGSDLTVAEMQAAWGAAINFIPVANWPSLNNNGGDTIALWNGLTNYQGEATTGPGRSHANAAAAVTYDNSAAANWPTDDDRSSIYWNSFAANQALGASWRRAGVAGGSLGSSTAAPIVRQVADNPGQDIASPGFVPSIAGDYNGDRVVNAADYTVWRNNLGLSVSLPNDTTPGTVNAADYGVWKANYGRVSGAGSSFSGAAQVPELSTAALAIAAAMILAMCKRR